MALWLYLKALGKHWWELLSCALFTIIGVVAAFRNWSNGWIAIVSIGIAAILLLVASGLAWHDEYKRAESEQAKNSAAPKIHINPLSILPLGALGSGFTDLFLNIDLVLESPSQVSIKDFSLMVFNESNSATISACEDILDWQLEKWADDNSLSYVNCVPLPKELTRRGDSVQGWIHFPLPDLAERFVSLAGFKVKLNCVYGTCYYDLAGVYIQVQKNRVMRKIHHETT